VSILRSPKEVYVFTSEAKFAEDANWVEKDLTTLKGLLETSL